IVRGHKIAWPLQQVTGNVVVPEQDPGSVNPEVEKSVQHRVGIYIEVILQVKLLGGRHISMGIIITSIPAFQSDLNKNVFIKQRTVKENPAIDEDIRNSKIGRGISRNGRVTCLALPVKLVPKGKPGLNSGDQHKNLGGSLFRHGLFIIKHIVIDPVDFQGRPQRKPLKIGNYPAFDLVHPYIVEIIAPAVMVSPV